MLSTKHLSTLIGTQKGLTPIFNTIQFQLQCKLNPPLYSKSESQSQTFPLGNVFWDSNGITPKRNIPKFTFAFLCSVHGHPINKFNPRPQQQTLGLETEFPSHKTAKMAQKNEVRLWQCVLIQAPTLSLP